MADWLWSDWLGPTIVVVVMAAAGAWLVRSAARRAARIAAMRARFAQHVGMRVERRSGRASDTLVGVVGDADVEIHSASRGTRIEIHPASYGEPSAAIDTFVAASTRASAIPGTLRVLAGGARGGGTGHDAFDRAFTVETDSPDLAPRVLLPTVRDALLALAPMPWRYYCDGRVVLHLLGTDADPAQLDIARRLAASCATGSPS